MDWLKSKTTLIAGGCLALIGLQGYGMMSMRGTMEERMSSVEREFRRCITRTVRRSRSSLPILKS